MEGNFKPAFTHFNLNKIVEQKGESNPSKLYL